MRQESLLTKQVSNGSGSSQLRPVLR